MKRIVLAGAGHAHIAALRLLARHPPNAEIILVNDGPHAWYTGALPALIRGDIAEHQARLNIPQLAAQCGAEFIDAKSLHFENNRLHLRQNDPLQFDILSLSTGGGIPGGVKPIPNFLTRIKSWDRKPASKIGIVGGGAAGVEIALALRDRLGATAIIHLTAPAQAILSHAPPAARRIATAALAAANITITESRPAPMDDLILAYTPPPTLRIRPTLQLTDHEQIFAAGDCATLAEPAPRSGAIAVRQGRVLAANLLAATRGADLQIFTPPATTLAIMSLSTEKALAWHGNLTWSGRLPMALKTRIDKNWLKQDFP